jgi:hypothetical protein
MSHRHNAVPEDLTRGYSNSFTDMLVRHRLDREAEPALTTQELEELDRHPGTPGCLVKPQRHPEPLAP